MSKLTKLEEPISDNNVNPYLYICHNCDWSGEYSECDYDFEFDEFNGRNIKFLMCPDCGEGLC